LKRRIREVCGLDALEKDERVKRAHKILNDNAEKQRICNEILGTSFKDIERAMRSIIEEKKISQEELEEFELAESEPGKYSMERDPEPSKYRAKLEPLLDRDYVQWLIEESRKEFSYPEPEMDKSKYRTYTREEVEALMRGDYNPEHFKYLRKKK
jgi:hypothetical protein